jgi:F0F1-type ATP synthase assembly protein I
MSTTLTFNEENRLADRRLVHSRRIVTERRNATQRAESSKRSTNKNNLALYLFGSVFAVVVGIMVLVFTGLLSGASSTGVQIILIIAIVSAYVIAFRRAFYF